MPRQGVWIPGIGKNSPKASDHYPVVVDINL
jgi:endonuclease/exonuclease/phosphatase family metal-dependent hydrolase